MTKGCKQDLKQYSSKNNEILPHNRYQYCATFKIKFFSIFLIRSAKIYLCQKMMKSTVFRKFFLMNCFKLTKYIFCENFIKFWSLLFEIFRFLFSIMSSFVSSQTTYVTFHRKTITFVFYRKWIDTFNYRYLDNFYQ